MDNGDRWESQRGDEWWFSSGGLSASAAFVPGSSALSIGNIAGLASARQLHVLLSRTVSQFPGVEPRLFVTSSIKSLLGELTAHHAITWAPLNHPFSVEACIKSVAPISAAT